MDNMTENPKIDIELDMSLSMSEEERKKNEELMVGYNENEKKWRLIIKYNGNISELAARYQAEAEILTDDYAIITIGEKRIKNFAKETNVEYIEKPKLLDYQAGTALRYSCISPVNDYPQYNLKGDGVLIGIVDSGIYYKHPDFFDEAENKSRILFIWDQAVDGAPPVGFSNGSEYNNEQITEAILTENEMLVPHQDILGHGTHVAGIAAGNGRASAGNNIGVAPNAKLIVVKLGKPDIESYPISTIDIMLALRYILSKAEELEMPIAINISYGSRIGPHDGTSIFEQYINEMALQWKCSIVIPTGNDNNKNSQKAGNIKNNKEAQFIVLQNTPNVSIDIWKSQVDFFNIEIISARGVSTGIIPYQDNRFRYDLGYEDIYIIYNKSTPFSTKEGISIEITSSGQDDLRDGIWTIKFHEVSVINGNYYSWITTPLSYFLEPSTENTNTIPSTVEDVISVAGYNHYTGKISSFSGRGYKFSELNSKPDIAAPCEGIVSAYNNGGYETLTGTSMAAPFVTGSAALMMEWGIVRGNDSYLYGQKLKSYLCAGAVKDEDISYPNATWGYGKLCLLNSFDKMQGIIQINELQQENEDKAPQTETRQQAETETPQSQPGKNNEQAPGKQILSPAEIEARAISEEYVNLIAVMDKELEAMLEESNDVILGYQFSYNLAIIYVNKEIIDEVYKNLNVISNMSYPLLFALQSVDVLVESNIFPVQNNPALALKGEGVLIGILDTGVDYTHPAFLYEDGTSKIKAIWDQTILTGNPPEGFRYGTEFTQEQINMALRSENPFDIVASRDEIGHGTFMAGVAAGREAGPNLGVAPDAELLVVKLRPAKKYARESAMLFDETIPAYQDTAILSSMYYLSKKGQELNIPLSVVLGMGTTQGSHDGREIYEPLAVINGLVLSAPAGNEGNGMGHVEGQLKKTDESYEIELNVDEGELGVAMYIWGYTPDKFSISFLTPSGEYVEKISSRTTSSKKITTVFFKTELWIDYFRSGGRLGDPVVVVRLKNPEPGMWVFTLHGDYIINGRFHAWLSPKSWRKAGTTFVGSSPNYTITEMGNSQYNITVGAYNHVDQNLYIESSRGPTTEELLRPDLIAPGVNISGPIPGGGYTVKSGTSIAAATVAGASALLLEWGKNRNNFSTMSTQSVRALLILGAKRRLGVSYPNEQYGYGQLDLLKSFEELGTVSFDNTNQLLISGINEHTEIKWRKAGRKYFVES